MEFNMHANEYFCLFGNKNDKSTRVRFHSSQIKTVHEFTTILHDSYVMNYGVRVDPLLQDMQDLGSAIYIADRICTSINKKSTIHIELPLHDSSSFVRCIPAMQYLLHYFTGNIWVFTFPNADNAHRNVQLRFPEQSEASKEVCLWSGGMDCSAGLVNRIHDHSADKYILFGTGSNTNVIHTQKSTYTYLDAKYPERISLKQELIDKHHTPDVPRNSILRSRGFVFMMLGAVCSLLIGEQSLYIYESGIGAINLPYRDSEVGLDHSRAVNPIALKKMGAFISELTGKEFTFINPFIFSTKAEMCSIFADNSFNDLISNISSCDRKHRLTGMPHACGFCSSCLLSLQALISNGITDQRKYVVKSRASKVNDCVYFNHMRYQAENLQHLINSSNPWQSLAGAYPDLSEISEILSEPFNIKECDTRQSLIALYANYAKEWTPSVIHTLEKHLGCLSLV